MTTPLTVYLPFNRDCLGAGSPRQARGEAAAAPRPAG